jgi:hypothetical protein
MADRSRIHTAIDELLDALDAYRRAPVEEELVRFRDLPIEQRARETLKRSGLLRTVRLGRELWTKREWLAAAVEAMPQPVPKVVEDDDVMAAARKRAARKAAA